MPESDQLTSTEEIVSPPPDPLDQVNGLVFIAQVALDCGGEARAQALAAIASGIALHDIALSLRELQDIFGTLSHKLAP